jgi:YD repeat-containing protein
MNIEINLDTTNVAFPIVIKDTKGNEIYKQWESGYWCKLTYDDNGNELTYKNSDGDSWKCTYDDNNNELTFKNSSGYYKIKGEYVTKEEYEAFINPIPEYTMDELIVKLGHNFKIKK